MNKQPFFIVVIAREKSGRLAAGGLGGERAYEAAVSCRVS